MQVQSIQGEQIAILTTFIKLPFVIKIFVLAFLSGRFTQVLLKWPSVSGFQLDNSVEEYQTV